MAGVAGGAAPADGGIERGMNVNGTAIVECRAVSKRYRQGDVEVDALRGVDLHINSGEFVSLSGPSGSGKSTLLNVIGGLDALSAGGITVAGEAIEALDRSALADLRLHKIGFVFQAFNLIPVLSAYENIEFIMQLQGTAAGERRARADELLQAVGLAGLGSRRPAQLSGGQQQRVAVARALASRPAIVLADEPTANLDSTATDELLELMSGLNRRYAVTFLIATHDPRVIAYTGRRLRMKDGVIEADEHVAGAAERA